jgi:peroxiredoxin
MKKIILLFGIFSLLALVSCEEKKEGNTRIEGNFAMPVGKTLYFYNLSSNKLIAIDSCKINDNGDFELITNVFQENFYGIGFAPNNYFNLILKPDDQIKLTANSNNLLGTYTVEGSEESNVLKKVVNLQMRFSVVSDSINREMQNAQQTQDVNKYMQASASQQGLQMDFQSRVKAFINENSSSIAALAVVEQLNPDTDFELFELVANNLKERMGHSPVYQNLAARVESMRKTSPGAEAPDLTFNDPNGNPITLSSFRGKYVLIDFWASWCRPCRIENPNVVKLYDQYKNKGFEIYGVSLDQQHDAWVNAIAQDQLTWPQVSDLGGWNSKPSQMYGVQAIPATFLLDPNGIIIAKNLRGEELKQKIAELLGS